MTRRVNIGSSYERVGYGESPTTKLILKNTSELLTKSYQPGKLAVSRLRRYQYVTIGEYRVNDLFDRTPYLVKQANYR